MLQHVVIHAMQLSGVNSPNSPTLMMHGHMNLMNGVNLSFFFRRAALPTTGAKILRLITWTWLDRWKLLTVGCSTENFINLSHRQRNLKRCLSEISKFTKHANFTKRYQNLEKYTVSTACIFSYTGRTLLYVKIPPALRWGFEETVGECHCSVKEIWPLYFNLLKPNDTYIRRTAALTSRRYILNIYSTNIHTEYFKHAA